MDVTVTKTTEGRQEMSTLWFPWIFIFWVFGTNLALHSQSHVPNLHIFGIHTSQKTYEQTPETLRCTQKSFALLLPFLGKVF